MKKNDPYNDIKIYHKGDKINPKGQVSALCYEKPRAIPSNQRYVMFSTEGVTCKKCLAKLSAKVVA